MNRNMIQQMQKMQKKMQSDFAEVQKQLEEASVEGVSGSGAVKVVMSGQQEIRSIKIDPQVVDPEDVEMLEDLILVAVRDGLEKSRALSQEKMGRVTAGFNIPGLF